MKSFSLIILVVSVGLAAAGPVTRSRYADIRYNDEDTPFRGVNAGRNIRPLACQHRDTQQQGICMFAWDCMKANGTHLGTCIDRFYFGSCCDLGDKTEEVLHSVSMRPPLRPTKPPMDADNLPSNLPEAVEEPEKQFPPVLPGGNQTQFPDVVGQLNQTQLPVNQTMLPQQPGLDQLPVNQTQLPINQTMLPQQPGFDQLPVNQTQLPVNQTQLPINQTMLPMQPGLDQLPVNQSMLPQQPGFEQLPVNQTQLPVNQTMLPQQPGLDQLPVNQTNIVPQVPTSTTTAAPAASEAPADVPEGGSGGYSTQTPILQPGSTAAPQQPQVPGLPTVPGVPQLPVMVPGAPQQPTTTQAPGEQVPGDAPVNEMSSTTAKPGGLPMFPGQDQFKPPMAPAVPGIPAIPGLPGQMTTTTEAGPPAPPQDVPESMSTTSTTTQGPLPGLPTPAPPAGLPGFPALPPLNQLPGQTPTTTAATTEVPRDDSTTASTALPGLPAFPSFPPATLPALPGQQTTTSGPDAMTSAAPADEPAVPPSSTSAPGGIQFPSLPTLPPFGSTTTSTTPAAPADEPMTSEAAEASSSSTMAPAGSSTAVPEVTAPAVPSVPAAPQLPELPAPAVPEVPAPAQPDAPALPEVSTPAQPAAPALPEVTTPAVPADQPTPGVPAVTSPTPPEVSTPAVPNVEIPASPQLPEQGAPEVPSVPSAPANPPALPQVPQLPGFPSAPQTTQKPKPEATTSTTEAPVEETTVEEKAAEELPVVPADAPIEPEPTISSSAGPVPTTLPILDQVGGVTTQTSQLGASVPSALPTDLPIGGLPVVPTSASSMTDSEATQQAPNEEPISASESSSSTLMTPDVAGIATIINTQIQQGQESQVPELQSSLNSQSTLASSIQSQATVTTAVPVQPSVPADPNMLTTPPTDLANYTNSEVLGQSTVLDTLNEQATLASSLQSQSSGVSSVGGIVSQIQPSSTSDSGSSSVIVEPDTSSPLEPSPDTTTAASNQELESSMSSIESSASVPEESSSSTPVLPETGTQPTEVADIPSATASSSDSAPSTTGFPGLPATLIPTDVNQISNQTAALPQQPSGLPSIPIQTSGLPTGSSSTVAPTSSSSDGTKKTDAIKPTSVDTTLVTPTEKPQTGGTSGIDSSGQPELPFFSENGTLLINDYKQICGRRFYPTSRIVGGKEATFGKWPWQVSLRQWRTSTYLHKCGAALLNENWAITAAHCVEKVPPTDLLLRIGEFDLSEEHEPYGYVERRVQIVATHPQFDPRTFEHDLALLRFYEPVVFQPNIVPICVPDNDATHIGKTATVTGWGRLYEDGPLPSRLQEVPVPIITNDACESMYRKAGYIEHIPDIFICAGWSQGERDSCEGDSGGPMVLQRDEDDRWVLGGVISWGIGCAEPNQPGVYTRISVFRHWINQILQF